MAHIKSLTPEQEAMLLEVRDRWRRIGLCTDPADRPEAEAGIREAYRIAGLDAPERIVWCGSPLAMALTWATVTGGASVWALVGDSVRASVRDSVGDSVRASVRDSVWASVRDSVWASVGESVWDSVGDSVRASVGDSVWALVGASVEDSVGDSVWASVRDSAWASVRASVRDSVGASVWASVGGSVYGQHDAHWLGYYDAMRELGLESETAALRGHWRVAKSAGWWLPHERICWVSERHNIVRQDASDRLHCEDGPAVEYPDGWQIHAVHGIRVPKRVVENIDSYDADEILGENNAEIRRVMMERYGYERLLSESGAIPVYADDYGSLYRLADDVLVVKVMDGTPDPATGVRREYVLRVHPELRPMRRRDVDAELTPDNVDWGEPQELTARNAVASTYGMRGADYRPEVRT